MITNGRQHRITNAALKRFEEGLAALKASGPGPDVHPRIHEAIIEANESQRYELREELEHATTTCAPGVWHSARCTRCARCRSR